MRLARSISYQSPVWPVMWTSIQPSTLGLLSEAITAPPGAARTLVPLGSVSVISTLTSQACFSTVWARQLMGDASASSATTKAGKGFIGIFFELLLDLGVLIAAEGCHHPLVALSRDPVRMRPTKIERLDPGRSTQCANRALFLRCATDSARASSVLTVVSQSMHPSVMLCP